MKNQKTAGKRIKKNPTNTSSYFSSEIISKNLKSILSPDDYLKLFYQTPLKICITNLKNEILFINKLLLDKIGYKSNKFNNFSLIVPPKNTDLINQFFENVLYSNEIKSLQTKLLKKSGEKFDAEIFSLAFKPSKDNKQTLIFSVIKDITEKNILINKLLNTERHAALGQFAGCIGHEMNNIVTALMGYLLLLQDSPNNKALFKKTISIFDKQVQRLLALSNNLLTLGTTRSEKEKSINLIDIVDQTIDLLKHSKRIKKCAFKKYYDTSIPNVIGDDNKFQQLFTNLILNASDAMENKGVISIYIIHNKKRECVEIIIKDQGCGIPKENLHKIFEGFFTTKTADKGTGLGMLVVKEIIDRYNGKIEIKSKVNKGTKVIVSFPTINPK